MQSVKLYSIFSSYGLDVAIMSAISVVAFAIIKKIFPKIPDKYSAIIKLAIAVAIYCIYTVFTQCDITKIFEKSISIFGISYAITQALNLSDTQKEIKDFLSIFIPNIKDDDVKSLLSSSLDKSSIEEKVKQMAQDGLDEKEISVIAELISSVNKTKNNK